MDLNKKQMSHGTNKLLCLILNIQKTSDFIESLNVGVKQILEISLAN